MSADLDALRKKLEQMRADLQSDQALGDADCAPVELDQTSVGRLSRLDAMQVQAMALANQQRRRAELARVISALRRIDSDDYGYCVVCGEEIPEARVMHNPAVTTCVGCAD